MRLAFLLAALAAPLFALGPTPELEVARGVLLQGLKDNPGNAELHTLLGFVYRKMDRIDDAQASFSEAVKKNPRKSEAHYMLGMILEKKGLKDEAKAAWKACLDSASDENTRDTARRHLGLLEGKRD